MVTLKDIARQAKVSVMTVSKAMRDAKDVSAETKARIKKIAHDLGYVPNTSAQGLRTNTTRLLGLVIPSSQNTIYARTISAIEERTRELGYDLVIAQTQNKPELEDACLRRLLARRVDGLFITPVYRFEAEARIYQEIALRKVPSVLLGPPAPFCKNFPSIEIQELAASHAVTKHLLELGHKKIAYLTGPPAVPWAHERFDGYRRALREANIEPDDKFVFQAGGTLEDGAKAALQMINEGCRPTAIQAVNDLVAIGCAETLLQQGWRIPEDVSVAGFGNILAAEFFRVPMTTVSQPKFRLGVAAVEALIKLIRQEPLELAPLAAELVERKSTAAPKAD